MKIEKIEIKIRLKYLNYLEKKNYNRIRKLIERKVIKRFTTFVGFLGMNGNPKRTAYSINDTIYIYCDNYLSNCSSYLIKENGKELNMHWYNISKLYDFAMLQYILNKDRLNKFNNLNK